LALAEKLNQENTRKGVFYMPFAKHHAERMDITAEDVLAIADRDQEAQSHMGPCVTAFLNARPVAMLGFAKIWSGVADAWLVASDEAKEHPMTLTKMGRKIMDIVKISMGLHRIQITVRTTNVRAEKWARAIGFEQECVMSKYGPDQVDYFLMARF
jgi:hypothetical protein